MAPAERDRLGSLKTALAARHVLLNATRAFFTEHGYLEVETPVRVPTPAMEPHIDAEPSGTYYLRTSPELHMKRMLAAGYERIFQIGPCFRQGERGAQHHPEYTMLEWYRVGIGYEALIAETRALLRGVCERVRGGPTLSWRGRTINLAGEWQIMTVRDAFTTWAAWDPVAAFDADRFDADLAEKVEPNLSQTVPVVLTDYPAERAAMARCKPDEPGVAERWELYVGGLELANAYTELNDPVEQERRVASWGDWRRRHGRPVYAIDHAFMAALKTGVPPSAGIALGMDRLTMLLCGGDTLDEVMAFHE